MASTRYFKNLVQSGRIIDKSRVMCSKYNALKGKVEWLLMEEDFDYCQQIARSSYADMLHDTDRNEKYYDAIKKAINKLHARGSEAHVLDIGTGTGLLAMMAARCGADSVVACEAFDPMSIIASQIIELNGFKEKIRVIPKRSTELLVGDGKDLPRKANVLVTEVFDTELIGEGAIGTFNHARKYLLEEDAIVIPCKAFVSCIVFDSPDGSQMDNYASLKDIVLNINKYMAIKVPDYMKECSGPSIAHDIQLGEYDVENVRIICNALSDNSHVISLFDFDWTKLTPKRETKRVPVVVNEDAKARGIFMFWRLQMDEEGEIFINCVPTWLEETSEPVWRDHWLQSVYYFPKKIEVKKEARATLVANHDEYSFWFDFHPTEELNEDARVSNFCDCGTHVMSRRRFGIMNDGLRWSKIASILSREVSPTTNCLYLGDFSLLGMSVAALGANKVFCEPEENRNLQDVANKICRHNELENRITWIRLDETLPNEKIDLIVAEPYFASTQFPLHYLRFWNMKSLLAQCLASNYKMIPCSAKAYLMGVQFKDLWKIRAPVGRVCGFDLQPFDNIIQRARELSDEEIEVHPLWEYPSVALTKPTDFARFDFYSEYPSEPITYKGKMPFIASGICDAVVIWIDWDLDSYTSLTTGCNKNLCGAPSERKQNVEWDCYSMQGVYFLPGKTKVTCDSHSLDYAATFLPNKCDFKFEFEFSKLKRE